MLGHFKLMCLFFFEADGVIVNAKVLVLLVSKFVRRKFGLIVIGQWLETFQNSPWSLNIVLLHWLEAIYSDATELNANDVCCFDSRNKGKLFTVTTILLFDLNVFWQLAKSVTLKRVSGLHEDGKKIIVLPLVAEPYRFTLFVREMWRCVESCNCLQNVETAKGMSGGAHTARLAREPTIDWKWCFSVEDSCCSFSVLDSILADCPNKVVNPLTCSRLWSPKSLRKYFPWKTYVLFAVYSRIHSI